MITVKQLRDALATLPDGAPIRLLFCDQGPSDCEIEFDSVVADPKQPERGAYILASTHFYGDDGELIDESAPTLDGRLPPHWRCSTCGQAYSDDDDHDCAQEGRDDPAHDALLNSFASDGQGRIS